MVRPARRSRVGPGPGPGPGALAQAQAWAQARCGRAFACLRLLLFALMLGAPIPAAHAQDAAARERVADMLPRLCRGPLNVEPERGATLEDRRRLRLRRGQGRRVVWRLRDGNTLVVSRIRPGMRRPPPGAGRGAQDEGRRMPRPRDGAGFGARRFREGGPGQAPGGRQLTFVDFHLGAGARSQPLLRGVVGGDCRVRGGRLVRYGDVEGRRVAVEVAALDPDMRDTGRRLPLNPSVPVGRHRACTRIGILDNGIDYTAPNLAGRLARDRSGGLVGLDVWEGDGRPFDYGYPPRGDDPRRSIFNPNRHGSMVAGVLLDYAAPDACIVPVRYAPFRTDASVGEAIAFMARAGVRVVSIQSSRARAWPQFRRAIADNPHMLFVAAAGNAGLDLNQRALYPLAYDLPNLLVVAGTGATGELWQRSNFGAGIADVAALAEAVPVTRFGGRRDRLSGTSFAAPKVAAFAARIAAARPDRDGAWLHDAVIVAARREGRDAAGVPVLEETLLLRGR